MPELPEVEVVKKSLESKIKNLVIKNIKINDGNLRYKLKPKELPKIYGLKIIKIERRSKFLLFYLNKSFVILIHLGMTGKFFFIDNKRKKYKTSFYYFLDEKKDMKHDRVIFYLQGEQKLIYNDVRKFGFFKFLNIKNYKNNFHLKNLGPEPLSAKFGYKYFKKYIQNKNKSTKNILMDQKFVSGLGNIYVNEILYFSKIKPTRKVGMLTNKEIHKIIFYTKKILNKAIIAGGSSIKNFSSSDGKKGGFQQSFKVYGRKDKNCSNSDCSEKIVRAFINNRSAFFCPKCQK